MTASREIHLVRRPKGMPVPADFAVVDVNVPPTGEGLPCQKPVSGAVFDR